MESYELVEPFETKDGTLEGLSADMCFTLGVEWELFRQQLNSGERFTQLVVSHNANRLVRMVERNGRFVEHHPHSGGWVEITVGDYFV
jgi:hypothetical protein